MIYVDINALRQTQSWLLNPPEDRFSHNEAHLMFYLSFSAAVLMLKGSDKCR